MARFVRSLAAAVSIACLAPLAMAAAPGAAFGQTRQPATEEALEQFALTEAQIQAFLDAQSEIAPILAKQPQSESDKPDPKVMAQLDAIAKKHKFASYDEFADVGANISLVMDGVDPKTKKYVGADVVLKQQIAEVRADPKMTAADKKAALAEMNEALKAVEPVKFPANIDLVVKYYDKIAAAAPSDNQ
jgi:hypothetical protein